MPEAVLAPVRPTFRVVARAVVPEAAALDEAGWAELESVVERALADRPAKVHRQLRLFLRLLGLASLARFGRALDRLDDARLARLLSAFEDAPALLLRRGFWGVRTLVFMGYYARPAAAAEIGYRAHPRGWLAREEAAS